jgi:HrpA-like RNA helicase
MAMIKSALELALEKTKDLQVDEVAIEATRLRQEGKKAAGRFLESPDENDLATALNAFKNEQKAPVREGMYEVLSAQIQLPSNDASLSKLDMIAKGFSAIAPAAGGGKLGGIGASADKKMQALFQQLSSFFHQYLDDMKNVEQVIRKQWAPKLREKEREMSARMGQDVHLDPMMDPEFSAFYKQNVGGVRQQYQSALEKAKTDIQNLMGIANR